jgi:hypothetical protein
MRDRNEVVDGAGPEGLHMFVITASLRSDYRDQVPGVVLLDSQPCGSPSGTSRKRDVMPQAYERSVHEVNLMPPIPPRRRSPLRRREDSLLFSSDSSERALPLHGHRELVECHVIADVLGGLFRVRVIPRRVAERLTVHYHIVVRSRPLSEEIRLVRAGGEQLCIHRARWKVNVPSTTSSSSDSATT